MPLTLTQSLTLPINPPHTTPPLTHPQIWRALLLKCRSPQLYVKPITACTVIEETPTFMKRVVTFKEGAGPPGGEATEDLQIRAPWKVDFYNRDSGAFINNTISRGGVGEGEGEELYLTFYFEWPMPGLEEGSEEVRETDRRFWGMAQETVQHTIDYAREMVREGKI